MEPSELSVFGRPLSELGSISVIQITGDIASDQPEAGLRFDHRHAQVLNLGRSERTIVVADSPRRGDEPSMAASSAGDQRFLADLPADHDLREIGSQLLERVRARRSGSLRYYEDSGRYVETPDNYWTVKIQPRDRSLVITVRGTSEWFSAIKGLDIKPDRGSYSRFKLSSATQLDAAVAVILRARRRDM